MPLYASTGALNVVVNDTSVTRGLYAASGAMRVSLVSGTSYTGLYAPDGSINVCIDSTGFGKYHPSGALRGVTQTVLTTSTGLYAPTGATYMVGLLTSSELLLYNDWVGFSIDFVSNDYTIKNATGAEQLTGLTPNTIESAVFATDFTDNSYSMRY